MASPFSKRMEWKRIMVNYFTFYIAIAIILISRVPNELLL